MNDKTICIIGAMDCEIESVKSLLNNVKAINQGVLTFYQGEIYNKKAVVVKSGVGKVCAAVCTQLLADKFNPDFIVNIGVAGGLKQGMQIGDVVIADKLVQHDFDATAIGYAKGYVCNNINSYEPTYFYSDKKLIEKLKKGIKEKFVNLNCYEGTIASGDMFVGSNEKKKEISSLFGAIAVEMEGAAIAHAAALNKIPFIVIRTLCDLADERAGQDNKFNEKAAALMSAKIVEILLN